MDLLVWSMCVFLISGVISKIISNKESLFADLIRISGSVIGSILGLIPTIKVLMGSSLPPILIPWKFFFGSIYLELDPLSAFFLIPIFLLSLASSIYGIEYFKKYKDEKNIGSFWFFFNILIMSMVLVVISKNSILFLSAWEIMSISSFYLVLFENGKKITQKTAWIYLSLTHLGAACLFVFFFLMSKGQSSLDFAQFVAPASKELLWLCFFLVLIGFGTKAGIMPLHIWLPDAHPAAPSPISALMSGVMIKMGIYGLVRFIMFLGQPLPEWGMIIVSLGIISGVAGVLFAIAQQDLKRLLAYSSIENIGIILIGLGLGFYGLAINNTTLISLGFAGGLLHILNHSLFKGLLFLSAGSVITQTQSQNINQLGGLLKKMPLTGIAFLVASLSISAIPPFNGFISEFLIYFSAIKPMLDSSLPTIILPTLAVLALTIIGGSAVICFTRAFSIIFLGEPRKEFKPEIKENSLLMTGPMIILGFLCIFIGIFPALCFSFLKAPVGFLHGANVPTEIFSSDITLTLNNLTTVFLVFILFLVIIIMTRRKFWGKRETLTHVTWDCGYIKPQVTMQYTGSSFALSMVDFFSFILRTKKHFLPIKEIFPKNTHLKTHTDDVSTELFYKPVYGKIKNLMGSLIHLQHGRIHFYILYIVVALLVVILSIVGVS